MTKTTLYGYIQSMDDYGYVDVTKKELEFHCLFNKNTVISDLYSKEDKRRFVCDLLNLSYHDKEAKEKAIKFINEIFDT